MKYFTKQWHRDRDARREARINSGELAEFFEKLNFSKVLEEFLEHGRSLEQETNPLWKTYAQKTQELIERERMEDKTPSDYWNYYEQIRPNLAEVIKNIANYGSMHDYIITDIYFADNDLFIIFEDYGVKSHRDWLSSVDLANYESDFFFISKLVFTNAAVLVDELSLQSKIFAGWLFTEVYINSNSYELHILTEVSAADPEDYDLAELIITFKDVIIEIEER